MTYFRIHLAAAILSLAGAAFAAPAGRPVKPDVTAPNWYSGAYSYDGAGNISQIGPSANENKSSMFSYDLASRLKGAAIGRVEGTRTEAYDFDEFGNITKRWINGQLYDFGQVSAATNRLLSPYAYDAAGNMTHNGGLETYDYDALNMMTAKHSGGGWDETYIYTPSDERIGAKISTESWSWTIRDFDAKVVREFKTDPSVTTWTWAEDYVWEGGRLVGGERPVISGAVYSGRRHFHVDHLGSPRLITNQVAQVISYHDYAPYGEELSSILQEPSEDRMNFTGHERDFAHGVSGENTGYIDYMHARYYGPTVGRFFSVDRGKPDAKSVQSWNRYTYVQNNPLRNTDPTGNDLYIVYDFSDSKLSKAQQRVIMSAVRQRFRNAGVKIVNSYIKGGAPPPSASKKTDMVVSLKLTSQSLDDPVAFKDKVYGVTPGPMGIPGTSAFVSTEHAPKTSPGFMNFLVNVAAHEVGHASQALPDRNWDALVSKALRGSTMESYLKPEEVGAGVREFSPEDAKNLQKGLNPP